MTDKLVTAEILGGALGRVVDLLCAAGVQGALALPDGRVLLFKDGAVEIMPMGSVSLVVSGLQTRDVQ